MYTAAPEMEAPSLSNYIIPDLLDVNFVNVNKGNALSFNALSPQTLNFDFNLMVDNEPISSNVPPPPSFASDEDWTTGIAALPLDDPSPLDRNPDFNQILDSAQTFNTVPLPPPIPSDGAWTTQYDEKKLGLLQPHSTLSEFPFPPVGNNCSTNDSASSPVPTIPAVSTPKLPKRRTRKRKAPLSEAEKEKKHRKFLERNRIAAGKCRAKKKTEIECIKEKKRVLEQENAVLKSVMVQVWDEVRFCRDLAISHAGCEHPPLVDWIEHNAESSAELDARCLSLLGKDSSGMLECDEGSPKSSTDDSAQSPFSSRRNSGYSSISSSASHQTSTASG